MKHKFLISLVAAMSLVTTAAVTNQDVQAKTFKTLPDGTKVDSHNQLVVLDHSHKYWNKWRKVVLTQDTTFAQSPNNINLNDDNIPAWNYVRLKRGTTFYIKNGSEGNGFWDLKGLYFPKKDGWSWNFDDGKVDEVYGPGFDLATKESIVREANDPVSIVTTKPIKVGKEKMAKYHYQVRLVSKFHPIKKGTKMKIVFGGMDFNWIMIKKGYTHSGLNSNHGYIWVVNKTYTDTSWFKITHLSTNNIIRKWTAKP